MEMRGIKRFRKNRFFPREPRPVIGVAVATAVLKELYEVHLTGRDEATYRMILRYQATVSKRLLIKKQLLHEKGKVASEELFKSLFYNSKPFLSTISKYDDFVGGYIPIPFKH